MRQYNAKRAVDDLRLDGGVWRLQRRGNRNDVLASCMHAGSRVLSLEKDGGISVLAKFSEHESMNYGSDVHPEVLDRFVSCSFYDKRVCVWYV